MKKQSAIYFLTTIFIFIGLFMLGGQVYAGETYEDLHCPTITKIEAKYYKDGELVNLAGTTFNQGSIDTIVFDITAIDPQGLPLRFYTASYLVTGKSSGEDKTSWTNDNVINLNVEQALRGNAWVQIRIDNDDGFLCMGDSPAFNFDTYQNFYYNVVAPSVACTSFVYSEWQSCQANGTQTRTIISSSPSSCSGGNPVLTQSCTYIPPICTSWTYSGWSTCQSNGVQTRTVVSSSPSGCSGGNPVLTQSCTYTPPTCTSWTYSDWSTCVSSQQTRTIISSQPANCAGGNPILSQSCNSITLCTENNWTSILLPTICPSNGQQTRKWTKVDECQGGISRLSEETIICDYQAPTCTSFTYSAWSVCNTSRAQSRSILSSSPSNCIGGNPVLTQNCDYDSGEISNKDLIAEIKSNLPVFTENQNTQNAEELQSSQLQNESTQMKNNGQEANQEKNKTSSQLAKERKSEVASAIQEILQVAERDSEVGQQIKIIAQTQAQNQEILETSLQKVQSRSRFTRFFIGPNYEEINNAKKLLEQNREQIEQLNQVKNQLVNQDDQQKLTEQIQLFEQSNQEIESSLNASRRGFSLFGWLFRLFAK